jgi:hypothetical protein
MFIAMIKRGFVRLRRGRIVCGAFLSKNIKPLFDDIKNLPINY